MSKTRRGIKVNGASSLSVRISHSGNYAKTKKALESMRSTNLLNKLNKYGQIGVDALKAATPIDTGKTAESWYYKIVAQNNRISIEWYNSNVNNHISIVLLLQYGHGTRNGGYVAGRDFINPAMKPIFDEISEKVWKEVADK